MALMYWNVFYDGIFTSKASNVVGNQSNIYQPVAQF